MPTSRGMMPQGLGLSREPNNCELGSCPKQRRNPGSEGGGLYGLALRYVQITRGTRPRKDAWRQTHWRRWLGGVPGRGSPPYSRHSHARGFACPASMHAREALARLEPAPDAVSYTHLTL